MSNLAKIFSDRDLTQKFVCRRWLNTPPGFIEFPKTEIHQSIASRFEKIAQNYSQAIAIQTKIESLTYQQLNCRANRFANAILAKQGKSAEVVAILLEKGANFIASILAVLKTGKIFVPLDASFPVERLTHIVTDAQVALIVTNNSTLALAKELASIGCNILNIDDIEPNISTANPEIKIHPDTPAYLIYTSGSTGKPKGVIHSHRHSLHYCMNDTNTLLISPEDRVIFLYSCSALGGILCIFYTLINGAALYSFNVKEEGLSNLASWLIDSKITIYHSFATLYRHFIDTLTGGEQFSHIRLVKLGGEATSQRDVENYKQYFADNCILYASLGASETGTFCNFIVDKHTEIPTSTVPIGYPVQDMEILLLDEAGEEVSRGEVGEIAVKSKYLALGYWQKPEQTNAAFLPVRQGGTARIYRTGDLGRIDPHGCLTHMGRKDFQVKIRGFRIEVAEIEMALFQSNKFKEVVVVARQGNLDEKILVAYVVSQQQPAPTTREIRHYLRDKLPDYMIPSVFVFLDALPLTPNGKVDRLALPAPDLTQPKVTETFVPPRNDLEHQLTQIWEAILGIQPIGVQDNFFDLGGNSLLAVRIFTEIEQKFGYKLPLSALFPSGTVEAIAQIMHQKQHHSPNLWSSLVPLQPQGSQPPLFLIHSLGGEVLCYRQLVSYLGTEQPVYGLQPKGLDGKHPQFFCNDEMAAYYIQQIQTIQPQGPYFLAGYSFGGVVVYEMARQLHNQGQKLGLVAMFDTCRPGYSQRVSFRKRLGLHINNLFEHGFEYIRHKIVGVSQVMLYHLQQAFKHYWKMAPQVLNLHSNSAETEKYLDVVGANAKALSEYNFPPYPGNIILLRTDDKNRSDAVGVEYDPQFGWGDLVGGGLYVQYIPGSHLSLLEEPHVKLLAGKFQVCLEKAQMMSLSETV